MRFAASILIAACAAVTLGIAMAFIFGSLSTLAATLALLSGLAIGIIAFRQMPHADRQDSPPHWMEWMLLGVFALASLRAFFWLLYVKDDELHILSPNNLGDLPLHMNFIRYFASGVKFWPENPIFVGEMFKYPLGADFFNSLLLKVGLPVERGLVWVGLAGCAITAVALWRWGRGFALAAFLFGGGLTGFAWLAGPAWMNPLPLPDCQATQTWKNLFLALLVTQRGLLFALPTGLFLLDYWRARYLRGEHGLLPTWTALLLYATLPLFNVHAFLYLSAALAGMFLFACNSSARWESFRFVSFAFFPATICAALITGGFSAGSGIHWEPGWMQNTEEGVRPVWFWLRNFGLYLVLWAILAVIAVFRGSRETRALLIPATGIFLACAWISFAPWPWDNTKLLLWCWLAVAPCLWKDLLQPLPIIVRSLVCFVLFFTGALSLMAGLDGRHDYSLVDRMLVRSTESAVRNIPPEARFASAPEYWHPLIILGRKVAMGYPGHLESHGITYQDRNAAKVAAFQNFMLGEPGWESDGRNLGIDYLYWGEPEEEYYPDSLKPWEQKLPVVVKGDGFVIYKLPSS